MSGEPPNHDSGRLNGENHKLAAPQRLQTLNSGRGGLKGGRFMPNAVNRRSKEERENSAPAIKSIESQASLSDDNVKHNTRGKLERRKQRQIGTRAEATGPLAAPSISTSSSSSRTSVSASASYKSASDSTDGSQLGTAQGALPRTSFRVKNETLQNGTALDLADVRINMGEINCKETYYPVRIPCDTTASLDTPNRTEDSINLQEQNPIEEINLVENSLYLIQLPEMGLTVGKTSANTVLSMTISEKSEIGSLPQVNKPVNNVEQIRIKEEQDVDMPDKSLSTLEVKEELPCTQVELKVSESEVETSPNRPGSRGRLGTLRKHASGKLTLLIRDQVYEVMPGSRSGSPEEVMLLNETSKTACSLGSIEQRLLVIPDLDSLCI